MNALEFTEAITAIANLIALNRTPSEIAIISAFLVQLGDTLATIATVLATEDGE